MTYSMTAFARHIDDGQFGHYIWELRSVNHRYCELFVRLPEELRGLESKIREQMNRRVKRGKIDCILRFEAKSVAEGELSIDETAVARLSAACAEIEHKMAGITPLNALDVLKWPGVLDTSKVAIEDLETEAMTSFQDALSDLMENRGREGDKLAGIIAERCDEIQRLVGELRGRVPEIIASIKSRYQQRIAETVEDLDPGRVEQECALLMQKLDVEEELDRLSAHLDEVRHALASDKPIGRRLDFLMQELNREANTLGSKSAHIDTSNASIDLKVLIEQIREQIQNIE